MPTCVGMSVMGEGASAGFEAGMTLVCIGPA